MQLSTEDGPRRQRQLATRQAIEAAALRLFRSKGYQTTTVDEIVAEVGISQRTFFRHFDSKEAVLFGEWQWQLDELVRQVEQADPTLDPLRAVRAAVLSLAHGLDRDRQAVMLRSRLSTSSAPVSSYFRQKLQPAWEQTVAEALAARLGCDIDVDLRPRTLAGAAIGALNAAIAIWVAGDCVGLLPDLTEKAFDVLRPDRGRTDLDAT
ncbi:TetR/AcrR family transcriptional regulator [Micromonospora rubida]